jgi:Tfp pilus assembly protein PilF
MRGLVKWQLLVFIGCGFAFHMLMAQENEMAAPPGAAAENITPAQRGVFLYARELVEEQRLDEARDLLRRLLRSQPDYQDALQLYLAVLVQSDDEAATATAFEQLFKKNAEDFRFLNNYAWFLATASDPAFRQPERALELARKAVLLAPGVFNTWSTMAEAYYINGEFEEAERSIREAIDGATRLQAEPSVVRKYQERLAKIRDVSAIMSLME